MNRGFGLFLIICHVVFKTGCRVSVKRYDGHLMLLRQVSKLTVMCDHVDVC